MLSEFGAVSALEMDSVARDIAAKKTDNRFDIRAGRCPNEIPFAGQRFDLICMFDVLEHIDEDTATLTAARALLAKDGVMLITVPAYPWLWSAHDEFLHHKRRYSATALREKAIAAGLRPLKLSYFNTVLFPLAATLRLKDRWQRRTSSSGNAVPPAAINGILRWLFAAERFLLGRFDLPFGVSLLCVLGAAHDR